MMLLRVCLILAALLAIAVVAACGASRSRPHSHLASGCEASPHRHGCGPTPTHTLSCDLHATPASVVSQVASASPGEVVCLASGDYSSFTGTSKSAPGITITSASGAAVTFNSGITLNLSSVQNFTLDGTGGGGTMTVGGELDMETSRDALQNKALNLTFQNMTFTGSAYILLDGPENSNITFNRDMFVDGNANAACNGPGYELVTDYVTSTNTTPSGITIEDSVWVAPPDLWNPRRAIQTAAPITVRNNVFVGYLAHPGTACNHIDTLQVFSGFGNQASAGTFTGNLCYDDYGCFFAFDGTSFNTITDNVCFNIERNCISLYADKGSVVNHNVQHTGGPDPGGCATQRGTVAAGTVDPCTSSVWFENSHKSGDAVTTGETLTNNISGSGPNLGDGPTSVSTYTNNLFVGASSPNLAGSATFVGGTNPTTWAGFELTSGSTGHAGGSDGLDPGIRASAGGPPTGAGSAPANTVAPALRGPPVERQTLATTDGTWSITGNVPTVTTYQWFDCPNSRFSAASCAPIQPPTSPTSANDPTYTLQASNVGHFVFSEVTMTNANGQVSAISDAAGPVAS
jgi:hypothetical protein